MKCSDFELFGKLDGKPFGANALEITIDQSRYNNENSKLNFPPGNYDVTITGVAVDASPAQSRDATFRI